jgi:hypothetical protein
MKSYLVFTLPEEREEMELAHKAGYYLSALSDMRNYFRLKYKHTEVDPSKDSATEFTEIVTKFYEILNDYDLEV